MSEQWEKVGEVCVDGGLVWVGDPSDLTGDDSPLAERFPGGEEQFVEEFSKGPDARQVEFAVPTENGGLGVVVGTGGDWSFPVLVRRDKEGRVVELRVLFE